MVGPGPSMLFAGLLEQGWAMSFSELSKHEQLRLRLPAELEIVSSEQQGAYVLRQRGNLADQGQPLADLVPSFAAGLKALCSPGGASRSQLRERMLEAGSGAETGQFLFLVDTLARRSLLQLDLVQDQTRLLTVLPQVEQFSLSLPDMAPEAPLILSRFALLRREGGQALLELPAGPARIWLRDSGAAALWFAAASGGTARGLLMALPQHWGEAAGKLALSLLLQFGLLVPQTTAGIADGRMDEGGQALAQWDFHDLFFHFRSRRGYAAADPFGGFFPYIGKIEPLPAVRPAWEGESITLPQVDIEQLIRDESSFTAVQEARRSVRDYDEENPLRLEQISEFLYRVARIRRRDEMSVSDVQGNTAPMEISWRPYPNGGASYELELYLTVDRCQGLEAGMYHYDPEQHQLTRIQARPDALQQLLVDAWVASARSAHPQVLITIAARFQRVAWKYRGLAYAVILRNVGALYQTMYLVATAMGMAPCALGSGDIRNFQLATGLDPSVEGSVGEFMLGSLPPAPPQPA